MKLDADACYAATLAHDRRFDGVFYVGATTTGVYCRPICPARTPRRDRCVFFCSSLEAEAAGFRACFLCRPELAPGNARVDALPALVDRAVHLIQEGFLNDHGVDGLAAELGVTARHLRRAMEDKVGVSPVELAQAGRLALAKRLLQDTRLSLTEVALASGFRSVRRFNALFAARFDRAPSAVRRDRARASTDGGAGGISLRLDFRPPFDWPGLLAFFRPRAIPGVELVSDDAYERVVCLDGKTGVVRVSLDPTRAALRAEVSLSLSAGLMKLVRRLRALFDLDARPDIIAEGLGRDDLLAPLVRRRPGLRLPGSVDAFESAVRAILGQQVSVRGATTLTGRLVQRFGSPLDELHLAPGRSHRFPDAEQLALASLDALRAVGLPRSRAESLRALAAAVASGAALSGDVLLPGGCAADVFRRQLLALPGIGDWTAQYLTLRVLHHPDAFPAGDLGVRKALGGLTASQAQRRAEAWRPWRSYAAMHLWTSLVRGEL